MPRQVLAESAGEEYLRVLIEEQARDDASDENRASDGDDDSEDEESVFSCDTQDSLSDGDISEGTSPGPRAEGSSNSEHQGPENDVLVASDPPNIDLHTDGEGGGDVASPRAVPVKGGSPSGILDPTMRDQGGETIPSAGEGPLDSSSVRLRGTLAVGRAGRTAQGKFRVFGRRLARFRRLLVAASTAVSMRRRAR